MCHQNELPVGEAGPAFGFACRARSERRRGPAIWDKLRSVGRYFWPMTAGFYRAEVAEGLSGSLGHASAQVWLGVWLLGGLGGDQCLALPDTTVAALAEGLLNESSDRKNAARDDC